MSKRTAIEASLPAMMYGFGDAPQPDARSVKVVEAMVRARARSDKPKPARRHREFALCLHATLFPG